MNNEMDSPGNGKTSANPYQAAEITPSPSGDELRGELEIVKQELLSAPRLGALTWKALRAYWPSLILISLVVYIPANVLELLRNLGAAKAGLSPSQAQPFLIVDSIMGVLATMSVLIMLHARMSGEFLSGLGALIRATRFWVFGFLTTLLGGLAIFVGLLAVVIPGIALVVFFMFDTCIVASRNRRGREALRYSFEMVRGRWWRSLGMVLFLLLPVFVPALATVFAEVLMDPDVITALPVDLRLSRTSIFGLIFALEIMTDMVTVAWFNTGFALLFLNMDFQRVKAAASASP